MFKAVVIALALAGHSATAMPVSSSIDVRDFANVNVAAASASPLDATVQDDSRHGVAYLVPKGDDVLVHITDHSGKKSIGTGKVIARDQSSSMTLARDLASVCKRAGIDTLHVRVRDGSNPVTETAVNALAHSGMKIGLFRRNTAVPHDGCRPPKRKC